jgi:hypothetical protein
VKLGKVLGWNTYLGWKLDFRVSLLSVAKKDKKFRPAATKYKILRNLGQKQPLGYFSTQKTTNFVACCSVMPKFY